VKYDDQVSKTYTVKIGNYNTSAFTRKIVRGVWVSDVGSDVFATKANITECVNICKDIGINTIFVVTYNDAKTKYKSQVMKDYMGVEIDPKYAGRDPLAEMIEAAKPHGIKVVAWFEYGFASVYGDNSGGALVAKYPSWASRDAAGSITEKNKFYWLDAFNPEVQQFVKKLMVEVVQNYPDLAGVQGDDRLPAMPSTGGYDAYTVNLYKSENGGANPPPSPTDAGWLKWRADKLNVFLKRLRTEVKAIKPTILFTMSPSPYPFGYTEYLQDWPTWVDSAWVDAIIPQIYRYNITDYDNSINQQKSYYKNTAVPFYPGVLVKSGSTVQSDALMSQFIQSNRNKGFKGEVFFFYEGLKDKLTWYQGLYPYIK
jgi:uncharacterized lipoprotein YddW (UPF0748 family)